MMKSEPHKSPLQVLKADCIRVLGYLGLATALLTAGSPCAACAESFTLSTIAGDVQIPLVHVDPGGSLIVPASPAAPEFTAPTIFAAPLPSGSGARALGIAGAFTAIADDATAASWNPAGLIQLERPELSLVYRLRKEYNRHWSEDPDYSVGRADDVGHALNYLSAVAPLQIWERNAVISFNLQEVFDFSQQFHADFTQRTSSRNRQTRSEETTDTVAHHVDLANGYVDVVELLTTLRTTTIEQRLASSTLGRLDFDQSGSVQALTPAFAVEVTPTFSIGAAANLYLTGLLDSETIRSRTRARYSGRLDSLVDSTDDRYTSGSWSYTGWYISPTLEMPLEPASGEVPAYSTSETEQTLTQMRYEGYYDVYDRINDFRGMNATFGALWTVDARLTLGFCLDLPWTARARQTKTVRAGVRADGVETASQSRSAKDVTFDFPLFWAAGAAWRWNDRLTSSLDVSQTRWSRYSYKAEGDPRINPLDGSPYGAHPVDDCWALRTGLEYLWVLSETEIPFRAGLSWEQRPAVDLPDEYWGISLGTGISLGKGANRVIIDVAYTYTWGRDVMGTLVPGQSGRLGTDVGRHDLYVSCIYHF